MPIQKNFRVLVLGASRGLGAELAAQLVVQPSVHSLCLAARKVPRLEELRQRLFLLKSPQKTEIEAIGFDSANESSWEYFFDQLVQFQPTHIVGCAAGGPFGAYSSKSFADHQWAWRVSFLFYAWLLHKLGQKDSRLNGKLMQVMLIGSKIAEDHADPNAASYAAAKHALRGLVRSLIAEGYPLDLRLFSPGYLDTDMLPKSALPRMQVNADGSARVRPPSDAAREILDWMLLEPAPTSQPSVMATTFNGGVDAAKLSAWHRQSRF